MVTFETLDADKIARQAEEERLREESAGFGDEHYSREQLYGGGEEEAVIKETGGIKNPVADDLDRLAEETEAIKKREITDEEINKLVESAFAKK